MSKNFLNWFQTVNEEATGEELAELAWNACKDKMLKILDNPKNYEWIDNENDALTTKAIEKLRNL